MVHGMIKRYFSLFQKGFEDFFLNPRAITDSPFKVLVIVQYPCTSIRWLVKCIGA